MAQDQKIWNRTNKKYEAVRIKVKNLGDPSATEKETLIRFRYTPTIESILGQLQNDSTGNFNVLLSSKKKEITSIDQLKSGKLYYLASKSKQTHGDDNLSASLKELNKEMDRKDAEFWERDAQFRRDHRESVYENGRGIENRQMTVTSRQLERGMKWLLEQISKLFNINGVKLFTLDRGLITDPDQLIQRGAYIIVPLGESLNDVIFYYLPDKAEDTSGTVKEVQPKSEKNKKKPAPKKNKTKKSKKTVFKKRSQSLVISTSGNSPDYEDYKSGSGLGKRDSLGSLASGDLPPFEY